MLVLLPATYLEPGVVQAHCAPISGILDAGRYPSGDDALIARVTADLDASGLSAHPPPTSCAGSTPSCSQTSATPSRRLRLRWTMPARSTPASAMKRSPATAPPASTGRPKRRWASAVSRCRRCARSPARPRRRLDVAEPRPQHRQHRDRLPQRRDRAARPPARRPDARECRAAGARFPHGARRRRSWLGALGRGGGGDREARGRTALRRPFARVSRNRR